jgi:hypothetical protein
LVERKSHGTFNMQRGRVKLPSYRNFLPDETTPAPAWVALLVTNGGAGSSVEIFWKGKGFSGRFQAAQGQQAIVFIPQALGDKPVKVILKAPVPATGSVDFVTLSPSTLHLAVTDTPRAVLLNASTRFANVIYHFSNDGAAPLRMYNCLQSLQYSPAFGSCPNVLTLAPGETTSPEGIELLMNPGSSSWFGTDPGESTDVGVSFSEKAGMNYVVRE